ncbi:unnamed protein product [Ilex paraguariensis]|uniref:long-chain-alcohol oxidase n=1 Tax=Ilex paraguariensis TaxID=185542 RepID=A0ABC8RGF7_9AQUA
MEHNDIENGGFPANGKQANKMEELGGFDTRLQILGERQLYSSSLGRRQMESLTAICDTFVPAINISDDTIDESVLRFYQTSASMTAIPQHVAWQIRERMQHPKLYLFHLALWLLSTRIGTLILCGRGSLSSHFPYLQKFSEVSPKRREEILLSWSLSFFSLLRMLYGAMKFLTLLAFFTQSDQHIKLRSRGPLGVIMVRAFLHGLARLRLAIKFQVNEKDENPSWKAIGYCGPDPDFKTQIRKIERSTEMEYQRSTYNEQEEDLDEKEMLGPLYKGIIDIRQPLKVVAESLKRSGFQVSMYHGKNKSSYSFNPSLTIKCDAVVIGSGSGGGVIAGVLAKSGYKVLVLEKGNYFARSNLSLLEGQTMDQMYLGHGLLATDDMGVVILAGSTVGGGSTINWSASIQTPPHVIKEWCEIYGLELFGSQLYKEAMDTVCQRMGVQSQVDDEGFNNMVLRTGCHEMGYPANTIPRNSTPDHYCGWCSLGCKDGRKKGTSETWLVDLVDSLNGAILPRCEAIKILRKHEKGRDRPIATGVAFEFRCQGMKEVCVVESKVTIVGCGALCTPTLLRRSGLKNPNIGKNLHLHPVTMAWGYFPDAHLSNAWPAPEKKSYEGGIMTAMSTVVGDFKKSGYGAIIQTPALHPGMFSALMPWVSGIDFKNRMCKFSRTAHIIVLARDIGSGELASPSSISYRMDSTDEDHLKRGLEKGLRILASAGAEEIGTHHRNGRTLNVKQVSSHAYERFVKEESSNALMNLSTTIASAHQMGSCRMGVDPKGSAVNPMGETWEVEGLYVADSSVFPTALGVNPMVTIQAISYCTAQSVLEALRRKKNE